MRYILIQLHQCAQQHDCRKIHEHLSDENYYSFQIGPNNERYTKGLSKWCSKVKTSTAKKKVKYSRHILVLLHFLGFIEHYVGG